MVNITPASQSEMLRRCECTFSPHKCAGIISASLRTRICTLSTQVISRETTRGTIELLAAAPLKSWFFFDSTGFAHQGRLWDDGMNETDDWLGCARFYTGGKFGNRCSNWCWDFFLLFSETGKKYYLSQKMTENPHNFFEQSQNTPSFTHLIPAQNKIY